MIYFIVDIITKTDSGYIGKDYKGNWYIATRGDAFGFSTIESARACIKEYECTHDDIIDMCIIKVTEKYVK